MNRIIRAFAAFIVSICLILAPPMAYANTSVGGWTAVDTVIAGATTTINATKTAGGKALKSSITVAASASKVGKYLIKGGGQAAIAYAMVELADGAIDWVLDPANNRIKYKSPTGGLTLGDSTCKKADVPAAKTANDICKHFNVGYATIVSSTSVTCSGFSSPLSAQCTPNGAPVLGDEYSYIPIDTVAAKVISNAAAGHAPSQEAVKATALEGFAAGEHDAALDAAATEVGTENPPDTENPPKDGEAVPFDPSSILSALSGISSILAGIMSSLTGFFDWWQAEWVNFSDAVTGFFDWAMADPQIEEPDMTPPEIEDITKYDTIDLNQGYVTASGQCPSAVDLNINFGVIQLSYEPLCLILEKLSGVIVAVAYISVGFMIIRTV